MQEEQQEALQLERVKLIMDQDRAPCLAICGVQCIT